MAEERPRRALAWVRAAAWALCVLAGLYGAAGLAAARAATPAPDAAAQAVPRRIVSMLPSLTETVCALGHCDALVAVDAYSDFPPQVRSLPRAGSLDGADVERILALRPDLVLLARSSRLAERLRNLGLRVVVDEPMTLADVQASIARLAALLGEPAAGARLWEGIAAGIDAAARSVPPAQRGERVYFEVDSSPYAAGPGSHIGELLARLGARNVVPPGLGPVPRLNPEFVVRADPQVVIVSARDAAALKQRPGWSALAAVRGGRVCALSPAEDDVVARPGPRLAEAARVLARCLTMPRGRP
ncbi:ABC transporter substrate-binding protein [Ramlibacter aquaticus]|uniref:ABC transporter substrate-binding protein n=1 Tax=Ramlibacter aquaticus TaxID=2780094 RepID=A0ABR9SJV3_9BURK|nr:ABC transporter substrate-binding protein [Ramlibacter aquaticus]